MPWSVRLLVALLGVGGAGAVAPGVARACGGFFCNPPAQPGDGPPIAQAAENVLFALGRDPVTGRGLVEAHVQIVYTGAADQFSWVVPMTSVPEIDVGSDLAFQILESRTRPSFQVQWRTEGTCKGQGGGSEFGVGCGGAVSARSASIPEGGTGGPRPPVEVVFRGNVGPYAAAVVRSDDPTALEAWLLANAYYVSPEASQIIRGYVDTGSVFVALRLQSGRDVSEIEPVVLRLPAEEGCVPLKLTAIAATPNLRVNVWVLGDGRAVPINYTEVALNLARLDWFGRGSNYDTLVADAVNDAGGNAFLTEYAQPAGQQTASWFAVPDVTPRVAAARTPLELWNALQAPGLPLTGRLLGILRKHLPMPASLATSGVTEAQFYRSFPMYAGTVSGLVVDGAAAAMEIREQVLVPMQRVSALVAGHRTLTRLATFISPEEMTRDPLFVTNRTLPEVSNTHTALARLQCNEDVDVCRAPVALDVEGGDTVMFRSMALDGPCNVSQMPPYDRAQLDAMPAAHRGWRRDREGEGDMVLDNNSAIVAALGMHNAAANPDAGGCAFVARTVRRPWPALLLAGVWLVVRLRPRRRPPAPGGRAAG